MGESSKTAIEMFEELCQKYTYPATPNTKQELIAFWSLGIAAGNEKPNDIEMLEYISSRMQESARNSKLYDEYPELIQLNDELLGFEDMHLEDVQSINGKPQDLIEAWHELIASLLYRTKKLIKY